MKNSQASQTHTPTPWEVVQNSSHTRYFVQDTKNHQGVWDHDGLTTQADAAFIVRAVNNHNAMLTALKVLRIDLAWLLKWRNEAKDKIVDSQIKDSLVRVGLAIAATEKGE